MNPLLRTPTTPLSQNTTPKQKEKEGSWSIQKAFKDLSAFFSKKEESLLIDDALPPLHLHTVLKKDPLDLILRRNLPPESDEVEETGLVTAPPKEAPPLPKRVEKTPMEIAKELIVMIKQSEESDRKERAQIKIDIAQFAEELGKLEKKNPRSEPCGIRNPGNLCYMISALQVLEATFVKEDAGIQSLLNQDLKKGADETLLQLEKRLLQAFSPAKDLTDEKKEEKKAELVKKLDEFKKLDPSNLPDPQRIVIPLINRIVVLRKDIFECEDKILFKWTFLLLMQAKLYGGEEEIKKALILHKRLLFIMRRGHDFVDNPGAQKDAEAYMGFWHDFMGITFDVRLTRKGIYKEKDLKKAVSVSEKAPYSILQLPLQKHETSLLLQKKHLEELLAGQPLQAEELKEKLQWINYRIDVAAKLKAAKQAEAKLAKDSPEKAPLKEKIAGLEAALKVADEKTIESLRHRLNHAFFETSEPIPDFFVEEIFKQVPVSEVREERRLLNLPPFLTLQLKRFAWESTGVGKEEVSQKIQDKLPLGFNPENELLDLTPYVEGLKDGEKAHYEVVGMVQHIGTSVNGGHYVSYVKKNTDWFFCDDPSVKKIDVKQVPFSDAYLITLKRA